MSGEGKLAWGEGTITERGERSFQARWWERQPDGSLRKRARSFPTRDAAEDFLRTLWRNRRDGTYVPPSEQSVTDLVEAWLERGQHRWKPSTHATYRQRAKAHITPVLGKLRAESLTTPRVQHWIDGMVRAGLDPSTVECAIRVLSGALREAVMLGILPSNPASNTRRPSVEIKEQPTWSRAEVNRVMAVVAHDPFWTALYRVALTTGVRPGELRAIRWADIDLDAAVVNIRRTVTKDADGHPVIGDSTKTRRSRAIALSTACVAALQAWSLEQKRRRIAAPTWHSGDLVFDRGDGRLLPLTTWQKAHKRFCDLASVPVITPHALRHTNATLALEAGQHPLVVSRRLGHKSVQITLDRYSHVSADLERATMEAFDRGVFADETGTG